MLSPIGTNMSSSSFFPRSGDIASRVLVWYARDGGRLFNYKHTWVALQREALASTKRMDKGTGHH